MKRILYSLLIIIIPFSIYSLSIGSLNLTIDRVLILLLVPIAFRRTILKKNVFIIIILLILSVVVSYLVAHNIYPNRINFYLPTFILSLFAFITFYNVHRVLEDHIIAKSFHWQATLLIIFCGWGAIQLHILNYDITNYPLIDVEFLEDDHSVRQFRLKRLFMPFTSAPRLGFVLVFLAIIIQWVYPIKNNFLRYFLVLGSVLFTFLTISRGPIATMIFISIFAYYLTVKYGLKTFSSFRNKLMLIGILSIFCGVYLILEYEVFSRISDLGSDASTEGHLGIRLRVLEDFGSLDFLKQMFGRGTAYMPNYYGVSSAHSSYFTQLSERGVFGLVLYLMVFFNPVRKSILLFKKKPSNKNLGYCLAAFHLFIIHFLYDISIMIIIWSYLGWLYGELDKELKHA